MSANFDAGVDYFAVLGVHFGANPKSVKQAYRRMARRYHPDVSKIHNAKSRFQEIAHAYEILNKYRDAYCRAFQRSQQFSAKHKQEAKPSASKKTSYSTEESSAKTKHADSKQGCRQSNGRAQNNQNHRESPFDEWASQRDYQSYNYGQKPIHGKDREVVYPITLRYAIRLLRLGSFYIPGLKVQMKFTRQAFEGKTFRLKDKGYKGLFGGRSGDYMVRFNIKVDAERFHLKDGDLYGKFEIPTIFLQPGKTVYIDSPTGRVEWVVPHYFDINEYIFFRDMGLPADAENIAGDLYAKLIPVD
ncbi:DnaJ domain-containing protein [Thiomicrorhabdus marina]|uniref:DnaJ domain-containing protein n=1 Tax=Thiomicrorhabdus marina TaxID=2818442 RepID=UPI001FB7862D|nr:DnaJ domain-containing protein [Thiomicrorhabdus marina]